MHNLEGLDSFHCKCKADNNQEITIQAIFWHAYYASQCTLNKALLESAKYIEKMLNHKKRSEGTGTLKPECLVTVAMIYEANSDGTIFSLERRTSNQPPLLQLSELNAQWLMLMLMCLLHIQTPNLNCRCQGARGRTLLYSNNMVKEWITFRGGNISTSLKLVDLVLFAVCGNIVQMDFKMDQS